MVFIESVSIKLQDDAGLCEATHRGLQELKHTSVFPKPERMRKVCTSIPAFLGRILDQKWSAQMSSCRKGKNNISVDQKHCVFRFVSYAGLLQP